jgi:hypothetical protein
MATKQPTPASLAKMTRPRIPKKKRSPITFRLSEVHEAALHTLAESVDLGPSALARRIVENYIEQHAPRTRAKAAPRVRAKRG